MGLSQQIERMLGGEPAPLARLISAVENGSGEAGAILSAIDSRLGRARVIGVTGPPGVGKSSLVSTLVGALRQRGGTVGVVAVDPSSPVSGGAILGDRVRMTSHLSDPGVFIRSVSARGHVGGLSAATSAIVDLLDASGRDYVIVETVGAGQSEVEIAELADCKVVVMAPGLGDDVQAIKSGILEIADVLVVNKADLPHAQRTRDELRAMLALRPGERGNVEVIETAATKHIGIEELTDAIVDHFGRTLASNRAADGRHRMHRLLARSAAEQVRVRVLNAETAYVNELMRDVRAGILSLEQAGCLLVTELFGAASARATNKTRQMLSSPIQEGTTARGY